MSNAVESLLRSWFRLKDEQTAMRNEFIPKLCTNSQDNGYGIKEQCIYRAKKGILVEGACDACREKHDFYQKRDDNAAKRTKILAKLRGLVMQNQTNITTNDEMLSEEK